MQEDTISSPNNEQQMGNNAQHLYYEVGRELLAKPNLMGELAELEGSSPVLVYCNTPSDADFVEVMLKKRGVGAQKLIGNVPAPRLERALEQIKSGELQVIVLTDIAARSLDIQPFEVAINYSVPADADTYFIRAGKERPSNFRKVITLVSPLELANFLGLKKNNALEIEKVEIPSGADLDEARVRNLSAKAAKDPIVQDEKLVRLAALVASDPQRDKVIALLIHNTFTVIPALRAAVGKAEAAENDEEERFERPERGYDRDYDKHDRGGRQRGGHDRSRGGNRRDSRRGGGGRGGMSGPSEIYEGLPADAYENGEGFSEDEGDSFGGGRNQRRRNQRPGGPMSPIKKDTRVYLGVGAGQNLSRDSLEELLKDRCQLSKDEIKHVSVRSNCSFFDIPEDKAEGALEKLAELNVINGAKLAACKAITINAASPQPERESTSNGDSTHSSSAESADESPSSYDDAGEDEEFVS